MAPTSSGFLVDIDGSPLAADAKALLISAHVDDSLRLPDLFLLRFRDPGRLVITKSGVKIGSKVKVSVATDGSTSPEPLIQGEVTALEAEFDSTGTYTVIRGYDQAHRLFRGRRTETYTQSTASDVATKVAQRAGLSVGKVESTSTVFDHLSQGGVTDWEFLDSLAKEIGYEIAVKDGKFDFRKPNKAETAPAGGGTQAENPAGPQARHRPAEVPLPDHRGRAGQGGAGQRLGRRAEEGVRRDLAGQDHQRGAGHHQPGGHRQEVR